MNVAQLERDFEKASNEANAIFSKHTQAAEKENRALTPEERNEIQAGLDKAKEVKALVEASKTDDRMRAEIESMLGEQQKQRFSVAETARDEQKKIRMSMGEQFVQAEEFQNWIKATRGRRPKGGNWASPVVTLHPNAETLTTTGGSPGSGGDLIVPDYRPGILPLLFRRLTVADLIAPGTTDSNAIIYMKESLFTNAADTVPEGDLKPESTLRFDQETDAVYTIAHWLPVTEQMLEDVPAIRSYIDARLRLGVQLAEEDKLLNGPGGADIEGIRTRTGLRADVAGGAGAAANAEAVFTQMMGIYNDSLIMPDGVIMNPTNWSTIQLMKDTNGQYMAGGPFNTPPVARLWGLPVVVTPAIEAGVALVGAFASAAQVFRKGGIDVQATNSHSDYFIRNLVAIRAEERLALAVYRPAAFGEVTGLD